MELAFVRRVAEVVVMVATSALLAGAASYCLAGVMKP